MRQNCVDGVIVHGLIRLQMQNFDVDRVSRNDLPDVIRVVGHSQHLATQNVLEDLLTRRADGFPGDQGITDGEMLQVGTKPVNHKEVGSLWWAGHEVEVKSRQSRSNRGFEKVPQSLKIKGKIA